eukprot:4357320-Prymnesium_polylepis.1
MLNRGEKSRAIEKLHIPTRVGTIRYVVPQPTDAAYSVSSATSAMEHNRRVKVAEAENTRRKVSLRYYEQRSAQALATALDTSLRPKAASLLTRLKEKHKDATRTTDLGI